MALRLRSFRRLRETGPEADRGGLGENMGRIRGGRGEDKGRGTYSMSFNFHGVPEKIF